MRSEVVGSPITRRRRAGDGRLRQAQDDRERPKGTGHFFQLPDVRLLLCDPRGTKTVINYETVKLLTIVKTVRGDDGRPPPTPISRATTSNAWPTPHCCGTGNGVIDRMLPGPDRLGLHAADKPQNYRESRQ